jgi:type VI secretion system secreted protein VgrG
MKLTQQTHHIAIETPLGQDVLVLRAFTGIEAISTPFRFHLDLVSENDSITFDQIAGNNVTVRIALANGSPRYWNGVISRFTQGSRDRVGTSYRAEMVPRLWFLSQRQDCRIFQDLTVVQIIKQIFETAALQPVEYKLQGEFPKREYCVQYRETDFNFVSRLMEESGIFYFFKHEEGKHTLVLGNTPEANLTCPNQPQAKFRLTSGSWDEEDIITSWERESVVSPSGLALADYNFKTTAAPLRVALPGENVFEVYDYPGRYDDEDGGKDLAKIRLQELNAPACIARAETRCRDFRAGYRFELAEHYKKEWNQAYTIVEVSHHATQGGDFLSGSGDFADRDSAYRNDVICIPYSVHFRPQRQARPPIVQGCQTATVVGPAGEEIYTDEYGRIKVQFHWDRKGKSDEKSSCWIRVAHSMAGADWGVVGIPRIGQEVVVDFLEGDPDRPIVTGCVHNAKRKPPYPLPADKDLIGFKSNSTKGGGGYNEIVLKDEKNAELIRIHGQRDMNTTVLHDEKEIVKNNKNVHVMQELRTQVEQKASCTVKGDAVEHFQANHAEVVDGERYLKANRIILEAGSEICIKVGGNHVHITPAGVVVQGTMVNINCGLPPANTTLSNLTPAAPEDPI